MSLKHLRNLQLRVAQLEKSAVPRTEEFYVDILHRKIRSLSTERILELKKGWDLEWSNTIQSGDYHLNTEANEALNLIAEELRRRK